MRDKRIWTACTAVVILAVAPGCVTKKLFRQNVEETQTRVSAVETAVEANERRILDLKEETDQKLEALEGKTEQAMEVGSTAMSRAEKAQQLAEQAAKGKILWTETLSDDRVRFSFDDASIPPEAARILDDLVARIKSLDRAVYIEIEGHTDSIGSEEYNYQLGEKRATVVRNYLASKGIPLHVMSIISYGESRPVADNSTPEGRAQNRRVVIRVLE